MHYLNFGASQNELPPPWQNLNAEHDIRKPLRFGDDTAEAVLAEHVIEHVAFLAGCGFVREVHRILRPGGVFRVCFPDPSRLITCVNVDGAPRWGLLWKADEYARAMAPPGDKPLSSTMELGRMLTGWAHQCAWTEASLAAVLLAVGFSHVQSCTYGATPLAGLAGVDGHHLAVGREAAELETGILEAFK
jgi:hypothetical protein